MEEEKYRPTFEEDTLELREHANLDTDETGLKQGVIYISTAQGGHGPRLKYYRSSPDDSTSSASFEISDNPRVHRDHIGLSNKEIESIKKFITLNKDALLFFWYDGTKMMSRNTASFLLNAFQKIDKDQGKKFDPKEFGVENPTFNKPRKFK